MSRIDGAFLNLWLNTIIGLAGLTFVLLGS